MKLEVPTIADFAAARRAGEAMNAISNLGGMRPQGGGNSILALRDRIADDDGKTAATVELAKIGTKIADLNLDALHQGGSESRKAIGTCRRALNQLADAASSPSVDDTGRKRILAACEWIGAHLAHADQQHKLDVEAARFFGGTGAGVTRGAAGTIHDRNGNRIGVMLTADDLRDEGKIAAKLAKGESEAAGILDGEDEPANLADFFRGVAGMRTTGKIRAALTEGTNSQGGFAVPTTLMPGILNALAPASSLLKAGANIVMLDETQAKSFNIAGTDTIPTAAWRSENGAVAESDPAFRGITITPQSLAFLFKVSRELLMDAPGIEQALRVAIAQAFAKELDRAGLMGTGTAPEIRGLANMTGVNAVSSGTNGAVLADYSPFIKARRAIADQNAPTPTAVILSTREDESVASFADTTGQPLRRPDALADWRFLTTTQIPVDATVGTSADCGSAYVGDFTGFGFYIREGVNVQLLNELYADTGQVGFVCHTRVDVAAAYAKAFAIISGLRAAA